MKIITSLFLGAAFGSILIFSEAFHWNRIQEMFRFESFHMFGLLFSAFATGFVSLYIIRKRKIKTISGNEIHLKKKELQLKGNIFGGLLFGAGWAITGACTAPIFILIGFKWQIGVIVLIGAILGVLLFAITKQRSTR